MNIAQIKQYQRAKSKTELILCKSQLWLIGVEFQ